MKKANCVETLEMKLPKTKVFTFWVSVIGVYDASILLSPVKPLKPKKVVYERTGNSQMEVEIRATSKKPMLNISIHHFVTWIPGGEEFLLKNGLFNYKTWKSPIMDPALHERWVKVKLRLPIEEDGDALGLDFNSEGYHSTRTNTIY